MLDIELLKRADFCIENFTIKEKKIPFADLPPKLRAQLDALHKEKDKKEDVIYWLQTKFFHKTSSRSFSINYDNESMGTQRYFGLVGVLFELLYKNRIVPIDEIIVELCKYIPEYCKNQNYIASFYEKLKDKLETAR